MLHYACLFYVDDNVCPAAAATVARPNDIGGKRECQPQCQPSLMKSKDDSTSTAYASGIKDISV